GQHCDEGPGTGLAAQTSADVPGRPVEPVTDPVNANTRGAGMLAAVALGELTFDEIPDRVTVSASHRPDPRTAGLYAMLYDEFVGLYRHNRKAHARLNGPGGSASPPPLRLPS